MFHEEQACLKAVSPMLTTILGEGFLHSAPMFSGVNSVKAITEVWKSHKGFQFMIMMQRVVISSLYQEYKLDSKIEDAIEYEKFIEWLEEVSKRDKKIELFYDMFVKTVVPGLICFRRGCRDANSTLLAAARKTMLPILAGRGRHNFAYAITRLICIQDYQATSAVKKFMREYGHTGGQGMDAKVEEINSRTKKMLSANSEHGWQQTSHMIQTCPKVIQSTFRMFEKFNKDSYPESRKDPNTLPTERFLIQRILREGLLKPVAVDHVRGATTLLGDEIVNNSVREILMAGKNRVDAIVDELRKVDDTHAARPKNATLSFIPLTESEDRKKSKKKKAAEALKEYSLEQLEQAARRLRENKGEEGADEED